MIYATLLVNITLVYILRNIYYVFNYLGVGSGGGGGDGEIALYLPQVSTLN